MVICNEHPEILERTEPTAALGPKVTLGIRMLREAHEMRVTSDAGADLTIDLRGAPCGGTAEFATHPGGVRIGRGACVWRFRVPRRSMAAS